MIQSKSISAVIKLNAREINDKKKPEHISVSYDGNGNLLALSWLYETNDDGLYKMAKRRGGVWDRDVGGWTFDDSSITQVILDDIVKKHSDWPIIGDPSKPFMPLSGIRFSRVSLKNGFEACLIPLPLPYFAYISGGYHIFRVAAGGKRNVGLIIGNTAEIAVFADSMEKQGATCDKTLAKNGLSRLMEAKYKSKQLAGQYKSNVTSPTCYIILPPQSRNIDGTANGRMERRSPYHGMARSIPPENSGRT